MNNQLLIRRKVINQQEGGEMREFNILSRKKKITYGMIQP